jgi:ubiquinone/menaquinone biosynthesis C-methylase UbiE
LLDVGCGDGLIGFGAIQSHEDCSVVFSDISQDLLVHTRALATEANVVGRTHFLRGSAECLPLSANSVDAITTRSVLIYVDDKAQAFEEFCRVLRPSGRLSIFEPINRFDWPEPEHIFFGYDVTPVMDVTKKVKSLYARLQPMDSDPMMNFDERDLLHLAEATGFTNIHLQFDVAITKSDELRWDTLLKFAGNPKIPTLEEAMQQTLTSAEYDAFTRVLRPLVEERRGLKKWAAAYLWATK